VEAARLDDKNFGPATGVYVDVTLPSGVQLASATADRGPGCASAGTGKLHCSLDWLSSDVPVGNIVLATSVTQAGELVLTATVGYDRTDPVPADNTVTVRANTPTTTPPPTTTPAPTQTSAKGVTKSGTARADVLTGTAFGDVLRGLGGNDRLDGKAGADRIYGGPGNDTITGGRGADLVFGDAGTDVLKMRDGRKDTVRCGTGKDRVTADRVDVVARDCESVARL
jgi:Ca2+-binding RTX toxin-like protein